MDKVQRTREQKQALLNSYVWHHSIDFGDGVVSAGGGNLETTNAFAHALLSNFELRDKTLLDIGAWNGAYSFAAKKLGAARVVASDSFCWRHPIFKGRETFELAKELNGLDVDALEIDVPDITPEAAGSFDAVLFSGVFYHLIEPVYALRRLSQCATKLLILETHQDLLDSDRPGMVFYPGSELNNDDTNWWGPNPQCVYELLKNCGFTDIFYRDSPGHANPETSIFRARGIYHAFRDAESAKSMHADRSSKSWIWLEDPQLRAAVFRPLAK